MTCERQLISDSQWIPIEEGLPPPESVVVFYDISWGIRVGVYDVEGCGTGFESDDCDEIIETHRVSHWMLMPLPPEL